jgi:high-affinity nickel permease
MGLASVLALGVFLGVRHATDADHVVAVTTLVSRANSVRAALSIGALWGIGHTLSVLIVGGAIVAFELTVPPHIGLALELLVALMLIALGLINLRTKPASSSGHGQELAQRPARSLLVGMVHGLAGSAALALLVLTSIREPSWALAYLGTFGIGTVAGMALLTLAMALPLSIASRRFASFERTLARLSGLASVAFGVFLAYQIGFVDGLFGVDPSWSPK